MFQWMWLRFGVREDNLFDLPSVILISNVQ
jgi:hypothetical protein